MRIADNLSGGLSDGRSGPIGQYADARGRRFVVARPSEQPALWRAYFDGARRTYRRYGVQDAVDFDGVGNGRSTSLFVAAVDPDGQVVGGLRVQGPYTEVDQADSVREWAGRAGVDVMRQQIADHLAAGVVEIKGVWADQKAPHRGELTAALARVFTHVMRLSEAHFALCTAASHAIARWESGGGVVSLDVSPVPYPDDRYRTWLMWWDRRTVPELVTDDQARLVDDEWQQLLASATALAATPIGV